MTCWIWIDGADMTHYEHERRGRAVPGLLCMALILAVTSGCTTLSEGQCVAGDWYTIGKRDGAAGLSRSQLFKHGEACAAYGTQPDARTYDAGRQDGLRRYCTPQQGFVEGHNGRPYRSVCEGPSERDFLRAFDEGKVLYDAEQRLQRIDEKVSRIEYRLDHDELDDKQRKNLHKDLKDQRSEHHRARRDLDRVLSDRRYW